MKTVRLSQQEFDALPDYSCSVPTGVVIGKKWKRRKEYRDADKGWLMGEYVASENEDEALIAWSEIEVTR